MTLFFLVGMPGAGKSYWGRQIAQSLRVPFNDLDKYIAGQEMQSVSDLFATYGEEWFRDTEHNYIERLIRESTHSQVIACGGGTPCYRENMELLNRSGVTIYLKAPPEDLLKNMRYSLENRPLLRDKEDVGEFLSSLLLQRSPFYEQAKYILHTKDITIANFEQIITSCTSLQ